MGCLLLNPVSGEAKFTPDVLRRTNLTSTVREALNARLREDVHGYIQLSTKKAVRQRMHAWVLAEREADPEFWPSYGRKGPRPVGELDGDKGAIETKRRRATMMKNRDEGKTWAGAHGKALRQEG